MDDAQLDALEDAMNAWENDVPGHVVSDGGLFSRTTPPPLTVLKKCSDTEQDEDDIVGYMQKKKEYRKTALGGGGQRNVSSLPLRGRMQSKPVIGYHEPTLFEKRRPQPRLLPLEERHRPGGWDYTTSAEAAVAAGGRQSVPLRSAPDAARRQRDAAARSVTTAPTMHGAGLNAVRSESKLRQGTEKASHASPPVVMSSTPSAVLCSASDENKDRNPVVDAAVALRDQLIERRRALELLQQDKASLQTRSSKWEQDITVVENRIIEGRKRHADLEKKMRRARETRKELGQLQAAQRTKENRLVDLKNMLRICLKRLDEAQSVHDASMVEDENTIRNLPSGGGGVSLPPLVRAAPAGNEDNKRSMPKIQLLSVNELGNDNTKSCAQQVQMLKDQHTELLEKQKKLTGEKTKLSSSIQNVALKQQVELEKLAKQRNAITKELERRTRAEFEQAKQHLLQNHEKGMHFREREKVHALEVEHKRFTDLSSQVQDAQQKLKSLLKTLHDLSATESALRVQLKDADQRVADVEQQCATERQTHAEEQRNLDLATKKLESMMLEKRILTETLSDPKALSAVQAVNEKERKALLDSISQAQQAQSETLTKIGALEQRVAAGNLFPRHACAEVSKPLSRTIPELRLRIQHSEDESIRLQKLVEETYADSEQKKKDAQRLRKQRDTALDKEIEELTTTLSHWKEKAKAASKENVQLETLLDQAERMIAMNNLRKLH